MCYVLFVSYADTHVSPTQREVASLRLPAFDWEVDQEVTRWPAEGEHPGEAQQTGKAEPVEGAKSTISFLLSRGLPPIPAKLVAKMQTVTLWT